jgi:hypothetical protein
MLKGSENPILPFYSVPKFYYAQQITGLLFMFPFAVFALVPLFAFLPNLFKGKSAKILLGDNNQNRWLGLVLC